MVEAAIDKLSLAGAPLLPYRRAMASLHLLVQRSARGDVDAWRELQETIAPDVLAIARGHRELRRKGLAQNLDHVAEIRVATFERLSCNEFANLKSFLKRQQEADPESDSRFHLWLWRAVDFAAREHLRKYFGIAPKTPANGEATRPLPSKADLHSRAGRLDELPERALLRTLGMTARLTSAAIFSWIEAEFAPHESRAMHLYYVQELDFVDIARELGLEDAKAADRLIRSLNARLRYRFSQEADAP